LERLEGIADLLKAGDPPHPESIGWGLGGKEDSVEDIYQERQRDREFGKGNQFK